MAITAESAFDTFIGWCVPSDSDREHAANHRHSIYDKLDGKYGLHRMFQSGSFSHGTGVKGLSDVDYFASLKSDRPSLGSTILSSMRGALKERFPNTEVHVSRPAVVLEFGSGYETCEIIPAYAQAKVNDDMRFIIPGVSDEWMYSTPEQHLKYVNACNQSPVRGKAKGFARLIKAWKYYRDVPLSSFYLEMRAAKYISEQETVVYSYDLCLFLENLVSINLAAMNDPSGSTGRIEPCSSEATFRDALSKLNTAAGRARNALDYHKAGNDSNAFYYWDQLFNGKFPAYR